MERILVSLLQSNLHTHTHTHTHKKKKEQFVFSPFVVLKITKKKKTNIQATQQEDYVILWVHCIVLSVFCVLLAWFVQIIKNLEKNPKKK